MTSIEEEIKHFIADFSLRINPASGCMASTGVTYREGGGKDASNAIRFDPVVLMQAPGTILNGYLQSWKYFHPHAHAHVKEAFLANPTQLAAAHEYIDWIRHENRTIHGRESHAAIHENHTLHSHEQAHTQSASSHEDRTIHGHEQAQTHAHMAGHPEVTLPGL
jgi:hypothetical protein